MADDYLPTRRTFLTTMGGAAALPLVGCLASTYPQQASNVATTKANTMNIDDLIQANLENYIHQGIFPIIQAEAVSKHKSPSEMHPVTELVKNIIASYGIENLQILQEGNSYPAVYGEIRSDYPHAPTILIQGHYDGQPSNEKEWTITKPHEPKIVNENGEHRIYGRGTSDDWGQVMTHLAAVEIYRKRGTSLPVNIKFLIEGGEEVGSKDMDKLIEKHKQKLACDVVMITDSAPGRERHPVITTSARGLVSLYVTLTTGKNPPHSGDNIADNAVALLAELLTSMKDYTTGRVTIPHFYDAVDILTPEQRNKLSAVPFDLELFRQTNGLQRIVTEKEYSALETMWARPSYELHTIIGGEKGNNIPITAEAYVTMRLVPHQDPQKIYELFTQELKKKAALLGLSPNTLQLKNEALDHSFFTSTEHPFFAAAEKAMEQAFEATVDYMGCGGTEPIALYHQQILKVPVIFNAYNSPQDHYHGNDESFSLEKGFVPGIKANILFYQNAARVRL